MYLADLVSKTFLHLDADTNLNFPWAHNRHGFILISQ